LEYVLQKNTKQILACWYINIISVMKYKKYFCKFNSIQIYLYSALNNI